MKRQIAYQTQRGVVLIVCLVFMLIMTVIAASAMQSTTLQERMAGNARDTNSAFQAAEAALRAAERVLQGASLGTFNGSNGLYQQCAVSATTCSTPDWSARSSTGWLSISNFGGGVSAAPQYYIEELPDVEQQSVSLDADSARTPLAIYRITARGFGVSDKSMVVLRTIYRRE